MVLLTYRRKSPEQLTAKLNGIDTHHLVEVMKFVTAYQTINGDMDQEIMTEVFILYNFYSAKSISYNEISRTTKITKPSFVLCIACCMRISF